LTPPSGLLRLAAAMIAATIALTPITPGAGSIYDSNILERIKFEPAQRAKVRAALRISGREVHAIFRKHGIDPNAKPDFEKLQAAASELQAMEAREKQRMEKIMTPEQYKLYLRLLQETASRIIKAARQ